MGTELVRRKGVLIINLRDVETVCVFLTAAIYGMAIYQGDNELASIAVTNLLQNLADAIAVFTMMLLLYRRVRLTWFLLVPIVWWIAVHIHRYELGPFFWDIHPIIVLILFTWVEDKERANLFRIYKKYLVLMAIVGLICFVAYTLRLPLPYRTVVYYGEQDSRYIDYTLCYFYKAANSGNLRFCGLFNEPGYFGTFAAFALCADKINLRKKENIILFIGGLLTFSLAFFLILAFCFALNCYRKPKLLVPLLILFVFYFFILPNLDIQNEAIANVVRRMTFVDGRLAGDNRTTRVYDIAFEKWLHSDKVLFGYGYDFKTHLTMRDKTGGSASYKNYLLNFGVIGTCIQLGTLLFACLRKAEKSPNAVIYIICNYISLYQRPYAFNPPYYFMLVYGLYYAREIDFFPPRRR